MTAQQANEQTVYQGYFGEYTIERGDRREVIAYRAGMAVAAASFALGSGLVLGLGATPAVLQAVTACYAAFTLGLGVSLLTAHIYLIPLHRLLQAFWGIGTASAIALAWQHPQPLALFAYQHPSAIWGLGFSFAALTGLIFKEAFCFNRFETKLLTPLVPLLLLGHMAGVLPLAAEQALLAAWSLLFAAFAARKAFQPIPPDVGDKSVFEYLKGQRSAQA